jgi:hypothetical protein
MRPPFQSGSMIYIFLVGSCDLNNVVIGEVSNEFPT